MTLPGDHPYFVRRTSSHMLPVYATRTVRNVGQVARTRRGMEGANAMVTVVKRADGNLFELRDDLAEFLRRRYTGKVVR